MTQLATRPKPTARRARSRASQAKLRAAPFALRIVRRSSGDAAIIYRRMSGEPGKRNDRLVNIGSLSPLGLAAASGLVRAAVKASDAGSPGRLAPGPSLPLDHDWGARLACFARVAAGFTRCRTALNGRRMRCTTPAAPSGLVAWAHRQDGRHPRRGAPSHTHRGNH